MTDLDQPLAFDHHSAECTADPVAYYARFREQCPVGRSDAYGGFTYTTRYADVVRIARDDATFSSAREFAAGEGTVIVIPRGAGLEQFPIELDPPRATEYRDLINPLLTQAAVEKMLPMIARHTTRIIDAFIASGSCDFVDDLTNPLPAAVTLDWLGFPESDWAPLAGPIHDIFAAVAGSERAIRGGMGLAHMDQRIRELVRERRENPQADAVSVLIAARRPDGSEFGEDELVSVIGLLIAGGVDTTTSLTGSTWSIWPGTRSNGGNSSTRPNCWTRRRRSFSGRSRRRSRWPGPRPATPRSVAARWVPVTGSSSRGSPPITTRRSSPNRSRSGWTETPAGTSVSASAPTAAPERTWPGPCSGR